MKENDPKLNQNQTDPINSVSEKEKEKEEKLRKEQEEYPYTKNACL